MWWLSSKRRPLQMFQLIRIAFISHCTFSELLCRKWKKNFIRIVRNPAWVRELRRLVENYKLLGNWNSIRIEFNFLIQPFSPVIGTIPWFNLILLSVSIFFKNFGTSPKSRAENYNKEQCHRSIASAI